MQEILAEQDGLRLVLAVDEDAQEPDWDEPSPEDMQAWRDGEVYGYIIERETTWQQVKPATDEPVTMTTWGDVDSCWGFYGREWAEENAREAFAAELAQVDLGVTA